MKLEIKLTRMTSKLYGCSKEDGYSYDFNSYELTHKSEVSNKVLLYLFDQFKTNSLSDFAFMISELETVDMYASDIIRELKGNYTDIFHIFDTFGQDHIEKR